MGSQYEVGLENQLLPKHKSRLLKYINAKLIPVETIPGMGEEEDKGES
jgi:hypothetical protein